MKKLLVFVLVLIPCLLLDGNPSSPNYMIVQWSFSSGSRIQDVPSSENYIISGSAISTISGHDNESENYVNIPGYYLGPITAGIIAPSEVIISVSNDSVHIHWNSVPDADTYKVFASENPYENFIEITNEGNLQGSQWTCPLSADKKFYYIKAVN